MSRRGKPRGKSRVAGAVLAASLLVLFGPVLSGCGSSDADADLKFPEFVFRSEKSLEGYRAAAANRKVLEKIPCYCGCVRKPEKYQNLTDCFYDRFTEEFNEHAAGCAICLDEALDVIQWKKEGLSVKQIREKIDVKYQGRGEPTRTPEV